jgi:membrane protease YdiL (CAAX protease family)
MPEAQLSTVRAAGGFPRVTLAEAILAWLGAWLGGNIVAAAILAAQGSSSTADAPLWVMLASAVVLWIPFLAVIVALGRRAGERRPFTAFGLRFHTVDLLGVPIGAAAQLVLVPALYWPLRHWWPGTFDPHDVEKNARELYDKAHGIGLVMLVLVVVIGAPLVEELVYRGLLQGTFVRRVDAALGVVVVAAWFALVHFRPVEYPGLFLFGLVLGACTLRTGRLGMGVLAHLTFNALGLALVARL